MINKINKYIKKYRPVQRSYYEDVLFDLPDYNNKDYKVVWIGEPDIGIWSHETSEVVFLLENGVYAKTRLVTKLYSEMRDNKIKEFFSIESVSHHIPELKVVVPKKVIVYEDKIDNI